jgi:hypothetical protein
MHCILQLCGVLSNILSKVRSLQRTHFVRSCRRCLSQQILPTHSWSWALLEKPPVVQLLENFPTFYGTKRFITVLIRVLYWSLTWARSNQSIPSHPISLRSILILSTQLCLGLHSVSFWLSHQYPIWIPPLSHSCYMPCPPHLPWLDHSMLGGSLVTTTWHILRLRIEETPSRFGGRLRIYWISSRGQPTRAGPPAWGWAWG